MLVYHNEPNLLVIPLDGVENLTPSDPAFAYRGGVVYLNQGWDEIEKVAYPLCQKIVERLEEKGIIEVKRVKFAENDEPVEAGIEELRSDFARKVINGCNNPKTLERWSENTKLSSELRGVVDIQLRKIEGFTPPKRM